MEWISLAAIIFLAHFVETVMGFGATLIALSLGMQLMAVNDLLVPLVLLGLVQSAWLLVSGLRHVDWPLLLRRMLPICVVGAVLGIGARPLVGQEITRNILGILVVGMALMELLRFAHQNEGGSPLSSSNGILCMLSGGFFHGLIAAGGPMVVYFASREMAERDVFRPTMSFVWLILNATMLVGFLGNQEVQISHLHAMPYLLPALALGVVVGEQIKMHRKQFALAANVLLVFCGLTLLV